MDYFFQYIFGGLTTLFTGLIAWIIFLWEKKDRKIKASIIILNDIYRAENAIRNIKNNKIINDYTSILPLNQWEQYQYLFVKNFDENELNKITSFFKSCTLAEENIISFKTFLNHAIVQKAKSIQDKLLELIESNNEDEYKIKKSNIVSSFEKEDYYFSPLSPREKIIEHIGNIDQLSLSSVGVKFKKIIDSKWYEIRV